MKQVLHVDSVIAALRAVMTGDEAIVSGSGLIVKGRPGCQSWHVNNAIGTIHKVYGFVAEDKMSGLIAQINADFGLEEAKPTTAVAKIEIPEADASTDELVPYDEQCHEARKAKRQQRFAECRIGKSHEGRHARAEAIAKAMKSDKIDMTDFDTYDEKEDD